MWCLLFGGSGNSQRDLCGGGCRLGRFGSTFLGGGRKGKVVLGGRVGGGLEGGCGG